MQLTLLLWLGCRAADIPSSRPLPSTPIGSLETGSATAHTGSEPAELPMPIPALEGWAFLPPGLRIVGEPWATISRVAYVEPSDEEEGVYFLDVHRSAAGSVKGPFTYQTEVIPANIPRGTHTITELWDGISALVDDGWAIDNQLWRVPDVTGDGIGDLWTAVGLMPGPLLGHRRGYADLEITAEARVGLAGFDADRDGVDDLLVESGSTYVTILYGPFEPGQVLDDDPAIGASPYSYSAFGDFGPSDGRPVRLPDLLGPGRDAFAVGGTSNSPVAYKVYPLDVPRGTRSMDAIAGFDVSNVEDLLVFDTPGDLDGDAEPELIVTMLNYAGEVVASPVTGSYGLPPYVPNLDLPAATTSDEYPEPTQVLYGIGDLNGDGVQELSGFYIPPEVEGLYRDPWVMVAFSPHALPLHFADALPIAPSRDMSWGWGGGPFGDQHADIDGDGLDDVIHFFRQSVVFPGDPPARYPGTEGLGEVRVWYGADLVAAENARRARTGRPPMGAAPEVP